MLRALAVVMVLAGAARADDACRPADPYDPSAVMADVTALAAKELAGRAPGTDGDVAARSLVAARFQCLGLDASEQPFELPGGAKTANVVGVLRGSDPDAGAIVVGAHLDHLGGKFLGANDNASGVAALLAIAAATAAHDKPRRTIAFVAFAAEEMGERGSRYYAAHAADDIVYDVNLDMVGSYASRDLVAAMGTFRGTPARTILDGLVRSRKKLHVGLGGRGERSDHEPFCARGIPYVFFWTPDDRCYHQTCDTPARIDAAHLAQIAHLAGDLVAQLADSPLDRRAVAKKRGCGQ